MFKITRPWLRSPTTHHLTRLTRCVTAYIHFSGCRHRHPALHQTGVFTRAAVDAVLRATGGCYRDGPAPPFAQDGAVGATLDVPVDLWWWLEFFARGLACGRVRSPPVWKSNVASMAWGY